MATCKNQKYVGRDVVLEYHIGCGDQLPAETDWKRFAALRTKEFTLEWETADTTADDSVGALRENIATFQTLSISGDGTAKASGTGSENLIEITKHVARPDATGGQPVAWMRMTFPDLTFTAFMLVSNMSRSAPFDDVVTFSLEASATGSDYGLIVEDTPNPDAEDPTSVEVIPSTLSLTVGQSFDAEAVVMPVGASQSLRWTSSNPAMATVNQVTGQITAVTAGSVTITAASSVAPAVTNTIALTVVPLVQAINVSPTSVSVDEGATQALTASVSPSGAASGLVYESAAPAVATVSNVGLVTGVTEGTTTVKITSAARPSVSVTVPVTVTAP
ncbi:phage tail tube protein [Achromobacter marplatensis]|uniref:phage tail tube protein n=1 Tax=Achromobacter marplatensis TaxID=470868 RepID=UPI0028EEA2EB|nr:phage tail tube protein [Achromobacter marplatensis]